MPQPLSQVRSEVSIRLSPDSLDSKPELAILVTRIFAQWSTIEYQLGMMLVRILGAKEEAALSMYSVITSQWVQARALNAAAKVALNAEQFETFEAVINVLDAVQKDRNKLAHWLYGQCQELPDALLLADPQSVKETQMNWLRLPSLPATDKLRHSDSDKAFQIDRKAVFVYRKCDLEHIKRDLAEASEMLAHFRYYINPIFTTPEEIALSQDGEGTVAGSHRRLSSLWLFHEALARLREGRKSTR